MQLINKQSNKYLSTTFVHSLQVHTGYMQLMKSKIYRILKDFQWSQILNCAFRGLKLTVWDISFNTRLTDTNKFVWKAETVPINTAISSWGTDVINSYLWPKISHITWQPSETAAMPKSIFQKLRLSIQGCFKYFRDSRSLEFLTVNWSIFTDLSSTLWTVL